MAGLVGGWLGVWLRKAENKAKAQQSWGLGFPELGNKKNQTINKSNFFDSFDCLIILDSSYKKW